MQLTQATPAGLQGHVQVPGDKSISHRALMFGAIAEGTTTITNFLTSDDVLHTMGVFRALGVKIDQKGTRATVYGQGLSHFQAPQQPLDMGNSGTSTRLLMGLLSRQPFAMAVFGDDSLSKRPLKRVTVPLQAMGASFTLTDDNLLPGTINANPTLNGITYTLPVASAQVKSAIMLAAMQAEGTTTIHEPLPSRDHTERMLRQFGGEVTTCGNTITLGQQPTLYGQEVTVPADISSAAFFLVAGLVVPGSQLTLTKVGVNPTRDGIITLLTRMGATITKQPYDTGDGEPLADLTVMHEQLNGITVTEDDIPGAVDELPILALAATQAVGDTIIRGAAELRVKETDRIATVVSELTKLGADIEELPDGMIIHGQQRLHVTAPTTVTSHGDHRIGMMLAIAAALTTGETVTLEHADAVSVSYPTFFDDLARVMV